MQTAIHHPQSEFGRGWRVLAASFLGVGVSLVSLTYYSAGIWVIPWQEEFGWSRAEIGAAQVFSTATLIVTAPFAGRLIDRFGLRIVTAVSLILFALGLFFVSRMNGSLFVYYAIVVFYTFVGVASSPLAFTRAVNAWFSRNRGLALGICLTGTGVAGILLPRFLTPFVDDNGWRAGFLIMALAVVVVVPLVYAGIRDYPHSETESDSESVESSLTGVSLAQAARTREFWTIVGIFLLIALGVCGLIPSFIPLLLDKGLSAEQAGAFGAVIGASVVCGRLLTGFLIDRFFAPHVTAAVFTFVSLGCLALGLGGVEYAAIAAIALGFAIGAEVDLIGYFTARYFGMKHYGTIYGIQYSSFSFGCGISPIVAGHIWDTTGSYDVALISASALVGIGVVLSLTLPKFREFSSAEQSASS
jgi:MFS family permease